jgi:ABC-2 type transport system permease protein
MATAGMVAAVFGVQAALRLRDEETALRAEPLLATATGRRRWLAGHLTVAVLGTVWLMAVTGLAAGAARAASTGDGAQLGRLLAAALVQVPAALVPVGIVIAGFGLVPRLTQLGWVAVVAFLLIGELGPIFELDQRVLDISPFVHAPKLPGGAFDLAPLVWLTAIAVALAVAGIEGFRRRDLG